MPILILLPNLQMGGSAAVAALSHSPLKHLVLEIDPGLGMTLLPTGNTLSLSIVATVPTVAPPGDKGMVCYINAGILTIYVWDTDTNTWLAHGAANATLISDLEAFAFMGYDG